MARKRMLSPEFFSSAPVNRLPFTAMLTFAGLWCYFDDYGRGEDDAALIKAAIWPRRRSMTEAKVRADLELIAAEELVCRYEASQALAKSPLEGGNGTVTLLSRYQPLRLIHSPSWDEHQKISHKTPSKLTPCPKHEPEMHADYLRKLGRFPETIPSDSRPPPHTLRHGSLTAPPRARGRRARLKRS